jgi:radical SAM superfamily enzyme YgiQ (UPF0313 family)
MKCTLIRCPQTLGRYISAGYAVPPIGLAYVAGAWCAAGHDVEVIDPTGEAIDQFTPVGNGEILRRGLTDEQILERLGPSDVIGFSLMFSQDWPVARALIQRVHAARPDAVLVAGGEHFTSDPEGALEDAPGLDYIVLGEGEAVSCDLLEHIASGRPAENVPGIVYRTPGGTERSAAAPRVKSVDDLPWPAWDLTPIAKYLDGGHGWGVDRGRNMPINATRGCPYQCTFCSSPTMWTTRWYARTPEDVIAEIKTYMERYQATNFDFHDLTAIIRKGWIIRFCELLIEEDLGITWQLPTGTRSEALDEEVWPLLYASGCRNVTYAPESGSDVILKRIKKKINRDRMLKSMRACVKARCNVKANFIFGFPGDRYREYWQTFGFLARMAWIGVHDISLGPFRPYPGSELFRALQERGVIPEKLDDAYFNELATAHENLPLFSREKSVSFAENMSSRGLNRLRFAAMTWFFLISWVIRPQRVFKLAFALVTGRQESRLDKSLIEMRRRVVKSWRGESDLRVGEINPH